MSRVCICYSTDQGYLYPTLTSALQARAQAPETKAGVCIVAVDLDSAAQAIAATVCEREGILFLPVGRELIGGLRSYFFRLFLDELLPAEFDRILYLDGDTQIRAPLDELLDTPIGPMQLMGASDPMAFLAMETGKEADHLKAYMAGLGFQPEEFGRYFNSGVLFAGRPGWAAVSATALDFFRNRREACLHSDQSALNAASRRQHVPMSLRWNFPAFLMNTDLERIVQPVIYHFMSNPRPWNGAFPPWSHDFVAPYDTLGRRYPQLVPYRSIFTPRQRLKYALQQRYKKFMELATWGLSPRRRAILDYEARIARVPA